MSQHPHHISPGKVILVLLLLVIAVVAVGLAGYLPKKQREAAANALANSEKTSLPVVSVAKVKRAAQDSEVVLPGSISPLLEASIYARVPGYVKKRYVDIGDRVKEGQLMAEIEAPELDQQVAQAQAVLAQSRQQLGQGKASLLQSESQRDLAKITSERYSKLVAHGAVALQDADTQQANFKTADALVAAQESNVRAAEENVRQSQANLDRILAMQDFKKVRAPFTGVVTARNIDQGSLIAANGGSQGANASGSEMYRVAQIGTVRILENVPQANAPAIAVGMPTEVTVVEFPGRRFMGKVARTSNSLDPNSRTMLVEVQVANRDGKLFPGMYANVRFRSHRDTPPFLVPGDAIIAGADGPHIGVLTPDASAPGGGRIHLLPVTMGRDFGIQTEILSGLDGSETVVLNPGDDVREGALVKADMASEGRGPAAGNSGAAK
jgi:RND family efflux transporter MFP subunit